MRLFLTFQIRKKKLSLLTILSFFALFNAPPTFADNSKSYQLVDLSSDLSTIVRILNGIALSQGLNDGSVDAKEVVRELMNLKPGVTLDDLEKDNVIGLVDDLAGLSTAVENECGGDDTPCIDNLKAISLGLTALGRIPQLPSGDFASLVDGDSSLNVMAKVKSAHDKVVEAKTNVGNVIGLITSVTTGTTKDANDAGNRLESAIRELIESTSIFSQTFSPAHINALGSNELKTATDSIAGLGAISSEFKKERTTANELHEKLEKLDAVATSIEPFLSDEKLAENEKKIELLVDMSGGNKLSLTEKTVTNGFFNGFSEFNQLSLDLKTPFVKDVLTNGTGPEYLQKILSPLFSMSKNLEPLFKNQEPSKLTDFIENAQKLKAELEAAKKEIQSLESLKALKGCVGKMSKLEKEVRIADWVEEKKSIQTAADAPKTFAEAFNKINIDTKELTDMQVVFVDSKSETLNNIKTYSKMDAVKNSLNNLQTSLDAINTDTLNKWSKNSEIVDLIPSTSKWFKENELDSISQCLNDKKSISKAKTEIGKRESLTAVLNLKPDNKYITEVSNAATSQKATITAWNEFKKAQKTRTTRAAGSDEKLKDALKLTRDLSAAVKIFRDLAAFHTSEKDFEELMKDEKVIDDTINNLKNDKIKSEIGEVWNSDTKYTLKNLKTLTDTVSQNIKTKPKQLSDFTQYFKMPLNFDKMVDLHIKRLITLLQTIKIPDSVYENLKVLDDMSFVNGKMAMFTASDSFLLVITFFKSLSSLGKSTGKNKKPEDESGSSSGTSLGVILGSVLGCVAVVVVVILIIIGICVCKKKKEQKVDPKVKFDKDLNFVGRLKRRIDNWIHRKKLARREQPKPIQNPPNVNPDDPATEQPNTSSTTKTKEEKAKEEEADQLTIRDKNETKNRREKYVILNVGPLTEDEKADLLVKKQEQEKIDRAMNKPGKYKYLQMLTPSEGFLENHKNNQDFLAEKIKANKERKQMKVERVIKEIEVNGNAYESKDVEEYLTENKEQRNTSQSKAMSLDSEEQSRTIDTTQVEENHPEVQNSSSALVNSQLRKETGGDKYESENLIPNEETGSETEKNAADDNTRSIRERIKDEYIAFMSSPEMIWRMWAWEIWKSESFVIKISLIASWLLSFGSNELNVFNDETTVKGDVARVEGGRDSRFELNLERDTRYFPDMILNDDATINFSYILSCITQKHYLDVVQWLFNEFPFPYIALDKAMELAGEKFQKDNDLLILDRDEIYVIGDIHGHILDLHRHISNVLYTTNMTILFLGDYVDRGMRSIDVVLMIAVLKNLYPDRVYFLQGNHEDMEINSKYGFLDECLDTFGFNVGGQIYLKSAAMFEKMPVAAIANRVWCAHGGISHLMTDRPAIIKKLKKNPKTDEEKQMRRDTLWSDPTPSRVLAEKKQEKIDLLGRAYWDVSGRWTGGVLNYGYKAVERFMKSCGIIGIIRAHFACEEGVQAHFGKLCLTVYGSTNNTRKNKACAAIIRRDGIVSLQRINNKGFDPGDQDKREPHSEYEKASLYSFFTKKPKAKKVKKLRRVRDRN